MSEIVERINAYLSGGGLFNPELANHDAVLDLIIDCRSAIRLARIAGLREAAKMLTMRAAQKRHQADHAFEADDEADQHGYSHAAFCLQQEADAILARIAELEKP